MILLLVSASAASAQGSLTVESTPSGARVEVDGRHIGSSPVTVTLEAGTHTVVLTRTGYEAWRQTIQVAEGEHGTLQAELVRRTGTVRVDGLPQGARAWVGDRPVTGVMDAPVGGVSVRVEVPGERPLLVGVPVVVGAETVATYRRAQPDLGFTVLTLLAPGGTQILDGREGAGVAFLGAFSLGLGVATERQFAYATLREAYALAVIEYESAESEIEIEARLAEIDLLIEQSDQVRRTQAIAIAAAGVVYLASAIDSVLHHTLRPGLDVSAPKFPDVSLDGAGVRLTFAL